MPDRFTFNPNSVCLMNNVADSLIEAGFVNVAVEVQDYNGFKVYELTGSPAPRASRKERGL